MALFPGQLTLTVKNFARALDISDPHAWKLISQKEVETVASGNRRLVITESVEAYIKRLRAGPPQDARRNVAVPSLGSRSGQRLLKTLDLATPIEDLGLSGRAKNALINDGVRTLRDLLPKTPSELLLVPNLGRGSLAEITAALTKVGLRLGMKDDPGAPSASDAEGPESAAACA